MANLFNRSWNDVKKDLMDGVKTDQPTVSMYLGSHFRSPGETYVEMCLRLIQNGDINQQLFLTCHPPTIIDSDVLIRKVEKW